MAGVINEPTRCRTIQIKYCTGMVAKGRVDSESCKVRKRISYRGVVVGLDDHSSVEDCLGSTIVFFDYESVIQRAKVVVVVPNLQK